MNDEASYAPLLAVLRSNFSSAGLAGFLDYLSAECLAFPPEEEEPAFAEEVVQAPEVVEWRPAGAVPQIDQDSETAEVAAWCKACSLNASVVGRWVWVDLYQQPGRDRSELELVLPAAGFRFAKRRQAWYHDCTIPCKHPLDPKRRGGAGKLERFHATCSAAEYGPGFDPRPHWMRKKGRKS